MGVFFQVLCTMIICTLSFNMGLLFTWPAGVIPIFSSENTTLHRPMTKTETSLVGSLSSIGGLLSTPISGLLLDKLGRKYVSICNAFGMVLAWTVMVISNRVEAVLIGVFTTGLGLSVILVCSIYTSEVCQASIRGAMTTGVIVSFGFGSLMSYVLGGFICYHTNLYVGLSSSILGVCLLFLLKETPTHLMAHGKEEEAAKSIGFFRHIKVDSREVVEELRNIKLALNPDVNAKLEPEEERLKPEMELKKLSTWQFLKKSQSTRRALCVNLVIMTVSVCQGLVVLQMYAITLFQEAIPSVSPAICSLVFAVVIVMSSLMAAYLSDVAGRRALMIYASFGVGLCSLVLGSQIHLHWGPNWITAISIYIFPICFACGPGTVPFVLLAELYLPEVRGFASMVVMEWAWVCSFTVLFVFTPLLNLIGLGPVFYIIAANCFFTSVFCYYFLPETKSLTVDAIQVLFKKRRRSLY